MGRRGRDEANKRKLDGEMFCSQTGKMSASEEEDLEKDHTPAAIRKRLESVKKSSYLGDVVLGAIDGCVTTFAVVSGVSGGQLPAAVALLLGTANLLADGFSMAVSNFQR